MNKFKRSAGFTLIEVMLVLAAAAIIAMATFFVYKKYSAHQDSYRITQLTSQLIDNIKGATSTAHCSGGLPCGNYSNLPSGATTYFLKNKVVPASLLNDPVHPTAAVSPWNGTITFAPVNSPVAGALSDSLLNISFTKVPTTICSTFVTHIAPQVSKISVGSQVVQDKLGSVTKLDPGTLATACNPNGGTGPTVVLTMDSPSAYAGTATAPSLGPDNGYTGSTQTYTLSCPVLDANGQPTGATQPCFDPTRMAAITGEDMTASKSGTCVGGGAYGSPGCYQASYTIQATQSDPSVHPIGGATASGTAVLPPFIGTPPPPPPSAGATCLQKLNNPTGSWQPATQLQTTWQAESQPCATGDGSGQHTWDAEYTSQRTASCADPGSTADPVWSSWGTPAPTGNTRNVVDTCAPTCMQLLLTPPWNSSPQTQNQWENESQACPTGDTGSHTWQAQQQQTRTAQCANYSSTDSPTWSAWSDWQLTGTTQNDQNTCSPSCATQLASIAPNPQSQTQLVAASAACPPGMIGSDTWQKQQTQSRSASCADPNSAAAPVWSAWSAWTDTGVTQGEINTCHYEHAICSAELSSPPYNQVSYNTRNVSTNYACPTYQAGQNIWYQPQAQSQSYYCADPNARVNPTLGGWSGWYNNGAAYQGPYTCAYGVFGAPHLYISPGSAYPNQHYTLSWTPAVRSPSAGTVTYKLLWTGHGSSGWSANTTGTSLADWGSYVTTYYYTLYATDALGTVTSNTVAVNVVPGVFSVPTLSISTTSSRPNTPFTLSWSSASRSPVAANEPGVTYSLHWSRDAGPASSGWNIQNTTAHSFTTQASVLTTYHYYVVATDAWGSVTSNTVSVLIHNAIITPPPCGHVGQPICP